jgi:peptide deformylase
MDIIKFPDPRLFEKCKPVTVFGDELVVLLASMWETMKANGGLGLASNQVGLDYNMFTMEGPAKEKLFVINPKITRRSALAANVNEGCLSAPGEFLRLKERSRWVEVEYQNEKGEKITSRFDDVHAVCVQHEMDHLLGKSHLQSTSLSGSKRRELAQKWGLK